MNKYYLVLLMSHAFGCICKGESHSPCDTVLIFIKIKNFFNKLITDIKLKMGLFLLNLEQIYVTINGADDGNRTRTKEGNPMSGTENLRATFTLHPHGIILSHRPHHIKDIYENQQQTPTKTTDRTGQYRHHGMGQ